MYCSSCGKEIVDGSAFCSFCGEKQVVADNTIAFLRTGKEINSVLRNSFKHGFELYSITREDTVPKHAKGCYISTEDSPEKIFLWKSGKGILSYYTKAKTIRLNSDSGDMFAMMSELVSIDTYGWDVSFVENAKAMFLNCNCLKWLDMDDWDFCSLINADNMFSGCKNLNPKGNAFRNSHIQKMDYMFQDVVELLELSLDMRDVTSAVGVISRCMMQRLTLKNLNLSKLSPSYSGHIFEGYSSDLILSLENMILSKDMSTKQILSELGFKEERLSYYPKEENFDNINKAERPITLALELGSTMNYTVSYT